MHPPPPEAFQIDPQELAAVVPACYAEFRPAVADALAFFLRHLSPTRRTALRQRAPARRPQLIPGLPPAPRPSTGRWATGGPDS
jgi:hypothetical protein